MAAKHKKTTKTSKKAPKQKAAAPARAAKPAGPRDPRLPAAGSTIEREWHDKKYSVKVGDADFEYAGKTFSSLTAVAKEITGAKAINGYFWWGLAPRESAKDAQPKKGKKPAEPKIGDGNEIGTPAGQRAALAEISKPKKTPKRRVEKIADETSDAQQWDAADQTE